jgi:hypothetical protein
MFTLHFQPPGCGKDRFQIVSSTPGISLLHIKTHRFSSIVAAAAAGEIPQTSPLPGWFLKHDVFALRGEARKRF